MTSGTSQTISGSSKIVTTENQVSADLAGEAVILNLDSGVYYGLDPIGAQIWQLIQEPRSVDEVRDRLMEEYDVEAAQCERDLVVLLQKMAEHALVEIRDGKDS